MRKSHKSPRSGFLVGPNMILGGDKPFLGGG